MTYHFIETIPSNFGIAFRLINGGQFVEMRPKKFFPSGSVLAAPEINNGVVDSIRVTIVKGVGMNAPDEAVRQYEEVIKGD